MHPRSMTHSCAFLWLCTPSSALPARKRTSPGTQVRSLNLSRIRSARSGEDSFISSDTSKQALKVSSRLSTSSLATRATSFAARCRPQVKPKTRRAGETRFSFLRDAEAETVPQSRASQTRVSSRSNELALVCVSEPFECKVVLVTNVSLPDATSTASFRCTPTASSPRMKSASRASPARSRKRRISRSGRAVSFLRDSSSFFVSSLKTSACISPRDVFVRARRMSSGSTVSRGAIPGGRDKLRPGDFE
mmetsp:Transcript_13664/g.45172  ORF Transcript_13664/g.45172 Transcript_13664/m.45172 type:complete len:249 (+) Transcript_13664:1446-2192(+)